MRGIGFGVASVAAISADGATTDVVTARFTAQTALDSTFGHGTGFNQPDFGASA